MNVRFTLSAKDNFWVRNCSRGIIILTLDEKKSAVTIPATRLAVRRFNIPVAKYASLRLSSFHSERSPRPLIRMEKNFCLKNTHRCTNTAVCLEQGEMKSVHLVREVTRRGWFGGWVGLVLAQPLPGLKIAVLHIRCSRTNWLRNLSRSFSNSVQTKTATFSTHVHGDLESYYTFISWSFSLYWKGRFYE